MAHAAARMALTPTTQHTRTRLDLTLFSQALQPQSEEELSPAVLYLLTLSTTASRQSMLANLKRAALILHHTFEDMPWELLRFTHVEAIKAKLTFDGYHPATVNATIAALRGVAHEAWRLKKLPLEDFMRIKDVKGVRGTRIPRGHALNGRELECLLTATEGEENEVTSARDSALVAILAGAGLRRAEASGLPLESYDTSSRTLTVRGKGNKERRVFLEDAGTHAAIMNWLSQRGDSPGPLLCPVDRWGRIYLRRLSPEAIYKIVRTRAREARIPSCSPHDLRHTFGTNLLSMGAEASDVQKLLGHARLETTNIYDHRDEESRRRAMSFAYIPFKGRSKRKPKGAKRRHRRGRVNSPPQIVLPKRRAAKVEGAAAEAQSGTGEKTVPVTPQA